MSQFSDCIMSAMKQGVLSEDEADALIARYEEHRSARAASGERDPEGAAKTALAGEMDATAAIKQAITTGQADAQGRIRQFAENYRDLNGKSDVFGAFANLMESFGGGTTSWRNRAEAIARIAHGEVSDFLSKFRRSRITGGRFNRPMLEDVGREMWGEATASVEAKGMAQAMSATIGNLRQGFNKAAGYEAIGKLEGGYIPQSHDATALLGVPGKTADEKYRFWRDAEVPRLDLDKMRDPLTGGPLSPERLEEFMRASWDSIVTSGWSRQKPTAAPLGAGALAKQRSDHRFFHYKSFDDWQASNTEFGSGDLTKALFNHIRSMAHDTAAMETFGPNPNATLEWMKQVTQSEVGKTLSGKPSLHSGKANEDTGAILANKLQAIFDSVRGPSVISGRLAKAFGDVSNVFTSAFLGSTSILAATTDPFIDMAARRFNGMPWVKALPGLLHAMNPEQSRSLAIRLGLGLDDFMHVMGNEARYSGILAGHEWSRWLADRTVNLNGLEAITQSRKHRFGIDFTAMAADHAGESWGDLATSNAYFRRQLENYGFTEKDWNALRKTPLDVPTEGSAGYLSPRDVKDRDLGVRYLSMILGETERAVPTGTKRSRAAVTQNLQRGTVWGELLQSALQFKSFTLSFTAMQWQAMKQELHVGPAQGAGYAASLAIPLTLGGAMAAQISNVINGKDLQPMDPTTAQGSKFWLQALFKGGGLGLLGDFIFSDVTRFGHTLGEQLSGPTISLVSDAVALTVGNVQKLATGKKTHVGRDIVKMAARNTPIISTLPYTRAAYQRMVIDQLQYLADPEAHKYFREQQQRMKRETGQSYWWRPGQMQPDRGPQGSTATK